jgi:hypothetical protein
MIALFAAGQSLTEHNAAHTPGAIAFASKMVASTRRVIVAKAGRGITTVNIEHSRQKSPFPKPLTEGG